MKSVEGASMNKSRILRAGLLLGIGILSSAVYAAEKPLASKRLVNALTGEVSGEIAFRYTDEISRYDRVQASDGFHAAAAWIKGELERIGYKDVVLEGWPSDGSKRYAGHRSVIGWKAERAELWMTAPGRERICSFEETPVCLVKHSHGANVEAELVDVGSGMGEASYKGRDVKGKIVLSTGPTSEVMKEAVLSRGAVGVLTYFAADTRPGYPNMIRYTALWPRWEEREKLGFGFNLSKNQGARLKRMLEEGTKIVLKAEVEAAYSQTRLEALSAAFPGSIEPEREVMIIGHLCHPTPSANDNGSGSGGMLEMARALKVMVDKGLVDKPARTIRFVWVAEFNGTVPYVLAHLERTKNTLAVINCDMIGEDLHKTGGMFRIFRTPDSVPSFLNDVTVDFTELVEASGLTSLNGSSHPFAWKAEPYGGGSDHVIFNDGALRVPSVMLNRGDTFHHTSLDTMDKVDPTELRRASIVALGSAYYIAAAGEKEALETARLIARNGLGRLSADYYDALADMYTVADPEALFQAYRRVLNVIGQSVWRETQSLLSTRAFVSEDGPKREIAGFRGHLDAAQMSFPKETNLIYRKLCAGMNVPPKPMTLSDAERKLGRTVPVRIEGFICPLESDYLFEKIGAEAFHAFPLRADDAYEALNFADGKRSVLEISQAVSAEFGPTDMDKVSEFFSILEKAGLVILKRIR
jgi:aminopeptidase YwaD